jgi:type I thyroxine 5'-deiodinase
VQFYVVYIREAHPSDAWQMASNVRDHVIFTDPKTAEERSSVAESCVRKLGIKIPALVDGVGDGVEAAYTGWPDRLYLIGRDGQVKFKSPPGPFGFHPAALAESLKANLN